VRALCLLLLVGCGRVGFDGTADGGGDGNGIADAPQMVGVFTDLMLPPGGHVRAIGWNGTSLTRYYVAYAGGRIFRVDNNVWTECGAVNDDVVDLAVHGSGALFAATYEDYFAYSLDDCATFTLITNAPTATVTVGANNSGALIGGYDGLWEWDLADKTFGALTTPFDGLDIYNITVAPDGRYGVSANGRFGVLINPTWYSTDIGIDRAYQIAFDPVDSMIVYSVSEAAIHKSTDGGMSFATTPWLGYHDSIAVDPANNQHILFMDGGGLYQSLDGLGVSVGDMRTAVTGKSWPSAIIFDPAANGRVLLATETGLFTAPDMNLQWSQIDPVSAWWVDATAETTSALYAGTTGRLLVQRSGGVWQNATSLNAQSDAVYGLATTSAAADRIYTMGDALERSDDRGVTFSTVIPSSSTDGWSFYTLVKQGVRTWVGSYARLTRSDDGSLFTAVDLGGSRVVRGALIRSNNTEIIATTDGGVYWSIDNGSTFAAASAGLASELSGPIVETSDGRIVVGSTDGLWATTSRGTSWTRIGFAGTKVRALLVTPTGALVAATDLGVRVTNNGGATWNALDGLDTYRPWSLAIGENNTLLVGTQGRGLFRTALP
jgi:hypothetical protein